MEHSQLGVCVCVFKVQNKILVLRSSEINVQIYDRYLGMKEELLSPSSPASYFLGSSPMHPKIATTMPWAWQLSQSTYGNPFQSYTASETCAYLARHELLV